MVKTISEEVQTSELQDKDFKTTVSNMLKELTENMKNELKDMRNIMYEQNESINKEIEIKRN